MQPTLRRSTSGALTALLLFHAAGCAEYASERDPADPDEETAKPTDSAADTAAEGDTDTGSDSSGDTDSDSGTDSGGDTGPEVDTGGCVETDTTEQFLDEADLAFTSTWTNGACPSDTRFDDPLARWDLLNPDVSYLNYYPLQVNAWGEVEWYGRQVWKVQFTALECTTSGSVYSTETEVRYLVCASDGVRLAGVEYRYTDSSNGSHTVELFDPPPLILPNDRTEGSVWSEELEYSAFWYDERAYPNSGTRAASYTLAGTMGSLAPYDVEAGTYDAQTVLVAGLPHPRSGILREEEETRWGEGVGLLRLNAPSFFALDAYELVAAGSR